MTEFVCIAVPYFLGNKLDSRTESDQIRASGFPEKINAQWLEISPDYMKHKEPVVAVNAAIAEAIAAHPERFPIVLASDCVSSLGIVKGLYRPDLGIVWYDAHGDFNTPETTPSGFLGGMPLAILVGRGNQHLMQALDLRPLDENRIVITDVRDLDPEEGENLRASQITIYSNVNDLLNAPLPQHPVYIHLDVDVIDPQYMPDALGYPAQGGPSPAEVSATLKRLAREGQVVGLLVSLFSADGATAKRPLDATLQMIQAVVEGVQR